MSKHTPGPWVADGNGVHRRVSPHYAACIATTDGDDRHANARLIAAAPDLLEACKGLLTAYSAALSSSGLSVGGHHIDAARKAIAKAESEDRKK